MSREERRFIRIVRTHYKNHGRHHLPWRLTRNPYHILVSEIMLQQTQVDRVLPKYRLFLKRFRSVSLLAKAPLGSVLREWQGLGYNRRAKMLHQCAQVLTKDHRGRVPRSQEALIKLPGIGAYTAGAILAFAYNQPIPIIETNIRSVFIHHFFKNQTDVSDAEIGSMVDHTLDRKDPRTWYYALMDYGVHIKRAVGNPNTQSKHYTKQSTFKGSDRQIRGALVRILGQGPGTRKKLHTQLPFEIDRIDAQLEKLQAEGMIVKKGRQYTLPS